MNESCVDGSRAVVRAFSAAMQGAVESAQVGFHFEEGGCWGMAAALAAHFLQHGKDVLVRYQPAYFVHAWVEVDGDRLDSAGVMDPASSLFVGAITVPLSGLAQLAAAHGCADEFEADTTLAAQVVREAWQRASGQRLTKPLETLA